MMRRILIFFIHLYRYTLSPLLHVLGGPGAGCRFTPTCSEYAIEALRRHGAARGGWFALRRVCRCHPWGGCGYDPVPEANRSVQPERRPAGLPSASENGPVTILR